MENNNINNTWGNEHVYVDFQPGDYVGTTIKQRDDDRNLGIHTGDKFKNYEGGSYAKLGNEVHNYSTVGINTAQIPQMKETIRTAVDAIYTKLENIRGEFNSSDFVQGEQIEVAINSYIDSVVGYCKKLCSQLLSFNDKLTKVQEAWQNADTNFASSVNSSAVKLDDITAYTEKY